VVLLHILRWRPLLRVGILLRRTARPLIGAREAIQWLLVLRMLATSHVGSRFLRRRWWERGAHLD
jgi:hypothetical protein